MWSKKKIAFYGHYVCIGMVSGLLSNALGPYCLYVAEEAPNVCSTLPTYVALPWGYKVLYGLLSDTVPICGLRRKPYMVIGWALTFAGALCVALAGELGIKLSMYAVASLFLLITLAYLIADCAADAALVNFSALEPAATRGSILSTAYLVRFTSNILSSSVLAFLFNGPPTQGSFSFGLTTPQLLWIVVATVGLIMLPTLLMLEEERVPAEVASLSFRQRLGEFHQLFSQPAAYRTALVLTAIVVLSGATNNATSNANAAWFHITPLQLGISSAISNVILSLGMIGFRRYLLNVSWPLTYSVGIVGMQAAHLAANLGNPTQTRLAECGRRCTHARATLKTTPFHKSFHACVGAGLRPAIPPHDLLRNLPRRLVDRLHLAGSGVGVCARAPPRSREPMGHHPASAPPPAGSLLDPSGSLLDAATRVARQAITFMISVVIIPEIAPVGLEGVAYGAITTFHNAGMNIYSMINNMLLAIWPSNASVEQLDLARPPCEVAGSAACTVRADMAYLTCLAAAIATSSLLLMPFFPRQKDDVARLKQLPPSPCMGTFTIGLLVLLMAFGTAFACLPIIPATSCLLIAGGSGC